MTDAISQYGSSASMNSPVQSTQGKNQNTSTAASDTNAPSATAVAANNASVANMVKAENAATTAAMNATVNTDPTSQPGADTVSLSPVAQKASDTTDSSAVFDRNKVDAIKTAIKNGQYPLNANTIAQSFLSIEQMIHG